MNAFMAPVRERRASLDEAKVGAILEAGAEKARAVAKTTLADVKSAMQLP